MAEERVKRRLAAILVADMVGYSRLMEADEHGTIARQKAHLSELIDPTIAEHHGRIVKLMGDGALVEFASVVDAVECAVAIQRAMVEREGEVPDDRRIQYRVGINLGDIVIDEGDIFGDGVNIAARLQEIAEPGGVCVSGTGYDQLKQKVDVGYEYLGEKRLKNITEPVRVYRIVTGAASAKPRRHPRNWWATKAAAAVAAALLVVAGVGSWQAGWLADSGVMSLEAAARIRPSLPSGPSIAVMPFANLSDDPAQDYFSDGLTEDVISALGRFSNLTVLANNATRRFKGDTRASAAIGRELGVGYLLEGSVRRAGNQIRVSVQLIDATTDQHLWANRYDNEFEDLFSVQDDITRKVVGALAVELTRLESERAADKPPQNLEAYDLVLRGRSLLRRQERSANFQAQELFERAIAIDPSYAAAYAGLGRAHTWAVGFGYTEFVVKSIERAEALARQGLALDSNSVRSRELLAVVYMYKGEFELAVDQIRRVLAINPSDAESYKVYGTVMLFAGHEQKAIEWFEAALRLDPNMDVTKMAELAIAYYLSGRYEDAITAANRSVREAPELFLGYVVLAAAHAEVGRIDQAVKAAQMLLRVRPFFTIDWVTTVYRDPDDAAHLARGLRKAGLKESGNRE